MEPESLEFGERGIRIAIRDPGLRARGFGVGIKWVVGNTDTYAWVIADVGMWISDDQSAVASEVRIFGRTLLCTSSHVIVV